MMNRITSKWIMAAGIAASALSAVGSASAQQTIRVGWTIPAEESKYWMMRRPAEFPDIGKTYNIEWTQFQGTSPMTQALAAGALDCATQAPLSLANGVVGGNLKAYIVAQHVFEKPGGFSVYWAVMDNGPIKKISDLKGKTVGISVIGGGTYGPFALLLQKNGVDPKKDIKLVEVGFAVSEEALRQGRVDAVNMNQPFAARAEAKGGTRRNCFRCSRRKCSEHRPYPGSLPRRLRRQESGAGTRLRTRYHLRHEKGAGQSRGNAQGRVRSAEGADPGARHLFAEGQ